MAQVVFALSVILDVLPFELGAAATAGALVHTFILLEDCTYRLPSLRTVCKRSMFVCDVLKVREWTRKESCGEMTEVPASVELGPLSSFPHFTNLSPQHHWPQPNKDCQHARRNTTPR